MRTTPLNAGRIAAALTAATLGLLLAGCDAQFTADFGTDAPADPSITEVQVRLLGLEFRRTDGTNPTLEFRAGELVDLVDLRSGEPLRLFTDEELPAGRYSGVRLLFVEDEDDNLVATGTEEFQLRLADGPFATVDFAVEDEESSEESLALMLDLRQSLRFDSAREEYTLTPRLRAVRNGEAARIEGGIAVGCPDGTSLPPGAAVYLFPGTDVDPDDLDGLGVEPLATTAVVSTFGAGPRYALRFLPGGDYTLALTCDGDEDIVGVDDALAFRSTQDVEVDEGEVLQRNLN